MSQELTNALVVAASCFGVPCLWLWAAVGMWSGRETSWLEDRRRGWSYPFGMFAGAAPFFGVGLFSVGMYFGGVVEDIAGWMMVFCFLVVLPACIVFSVWWAPRWVLPGWIRERLDAGDECRSALPPKHLRPVMTYRQNLPDQSWRPSPEQLELPTVLRVNLLRWGVSAVVVLGFGVLAAAAALGLAPVDDAPMARMLLWLTPVVAVGLLAVGVYYLFGFFWPRHVELTEDGVRTRDWSLSWEEIERVVVNKAQIGLWVTPEAFERVRPLNRWFSGRPQGFGGLLAKDGVVALQSGMKNKAQAIVLIQHVLWLKTGRKSDPRQPEDVLHGEPASADDQFGFEGFHLGRIHDA